MDSAGSFAIVVGATCDVRLLDGEIVARMLLPTIVLNGVLGYWTYLYKPTRYRLRRRIIRTTSCAAST